MKKSVFCFLSLFYMLSLSAQYDDYKLDSYVNPVYKRQELNVGLSSAGNINSSKYMDSGNERYNRGNKFLNGGVSLDFNKQKNSENFQGKTLMGFSGSGSYSKNKQEYSSPNYIDNQTNDSYNLSVSLDHQGYYYNKNKKFIEFSPYLNVGMNGTNKKNEYTNYTKEENEHRYRIDAKISIGVGTGRIEAVEDARQAVYILQDLQKRNILTKTLSEEEINLFAQQITAIKYKRQFDSRVKLIEEITTIDSFLVANGYVDRSNPTPYYTTLYDDWMYAGLIQRSAGSRFSIGITPEYSFSEVGMKEIYDPSSSGNSCDDTYNGYSLGGAFYINYVNEKPVNLYWQRSVEVVSNTSFKRYGNWDEDEIMSSLSGMYKLGYYPNTRTSLSGSASQGLTWVELDNLISSKTELAFQASYYVSPQLRISGTCGFEYSFLRIMDSDEEKYDNYPSVRFSFNLIYSIF